MQNQQSYPKLQNSTINICYQRTTTAIKCKRALIYNNTSIKCALNNQYLLVETTSIFTFLKHFNAETPDIIIVNNSCDADTETVLSKLHDLMVYPVPIIVLSREIENDALIKWLRQGADMVLNSNIASSVLNAQIGALIKKQDNIKSYYQQLPINNGLLSDSFQNRFINRARKVVLSNYTNCNFNIEQFVKEMHVSRTLLHVNLRNYTGKSTSEFVRDIRLEEAARLLKEGYYNVSEVAFKVGFSDPKYLSKKFKLKYGLTPNQFRRGII